jgi:hypothetical protein
MKSVNPIGNVVDRTAERPETVRWQDIGGLNDAKVCQLRHSDDEKIIQISNLSIMFVFLA